MAKQKKKPKENKTILLRESEVKRMKKECVERAMEYAYIVMLNVLRDYFGFGATRLKRAFDGITDLSDSVTKGYVSFNDLEKVLFDEAGIVIKLGDRVSKFWKGRNE